MALADTANLIVSLKLDDRFSGPLRGVNRQLDSFVAKSSVRGGLNQIGMGLGLGLQRGAVIGAAGLAVLSTQVRAGVESLRELENANAQTVAGLKSTGGVSGQTLESIRALSEEYETLGGVIDDKVIQAGANVLLTFRRVGEDAFQPALEQALNLSTALGTDLQTAILQVGKALDDPVRGVTALRRAGVQLSEQQQKQIKTLVEQNDLYGAQQIILAELERQVGGRFAAAGETNEATVARMGDAWEDLQMTLARGFLPAIDKVARRLTTVFADPQVIAGVEDFGERLAGFLTAENLDKAEDAIRGTFGYLASIPWGAIGDGLRIAGQAASVAVNAFKSLPPGVQNALITLLAANKLTGGLVASGLGQLAGVALSSLKTITAGNVTVIGGKVTAGGPAPTGGGALATAGTAVGAALGLTAITAIGEQIHRDLAPIEHEFNELAAQQRKTRIEIEAGVNTLAQELGVTPETIRSQMIPILRAGNRTWDQALEAVRSGNRTALTTQGITRGIDQKTAAAHAAALRTASAAERTAAKDFSFDPKITTQNNISVGITNVVNASVIASQIHTLRTTTSSGGFI